MTVHDVDVVPTGEHEPALDGSTDVARLVRLREFRGRLPPDFTFDRELANARSAEEARSAE